MLPTIGPTTGSDCGHLGRDQAYQIGKSEQKFANIEAYRRMLKKVLDSDPKKGLIRAPSGISAPTPDYRQKKSSLPSWTNCCLTTDITRIQPHIRGSTQTALYGDHEPKPGEIDLLYMPPRRSTKRIHAAVQSSRISSHFDDADSTERQDMNYLDYHSLATAS